MVTMTHCRRLFRRNCLLITLLLLVLGITYYRRRGHTEAPTINLPPMPKKLDKFLKDSQKTLHDSIDHVLRAKNPASLTFQEHFVETKEDGTVLKWIHESDFQLPKDDKMSRMIDLNSLMDGNGYLKLDIVDGIMKDGLNGVHLSIDNLGQAKVIVAALTTRPYKIQAPVLISAKVLSGPNTIECRREKKCPYVEPVLADSLVPLLKTDLRAQLGLGWTDYYDPTSVNRAYSWRHVIAMYELTREVRKETLTVVYMVRAVLAGGSIPQLKWLAEVTGANMVLEAGVSDAKLRYLPGDIALFANIIPKSSVFLRLPRMLREKVVDELGRFAMPNEWNNYLDTVAYDDNAWKVVMPYDEKYFLRGSHALLMYPSANHPCYIGTVDTVTLVRRQVTKIVGRVIFFEEGENLQAGKFSSGLKIFLDTKYESITTFGTQVLIGSSGYFSISSYSKRRDIIMLDQKLKTVNPCYQFEIEAEPRGIDVTLNSPIDCNFPLVQKVQELVKLRLDVTLSTSPFRIYIQPVGREPVLLDQFRVLK